MDPIKVIGVILITSFLLDRIVAGLFFLLEFSERWRKFLPDPDALRDPKERAAAARKRKLVYAASAGFLGTTIIAWYLNIRLLTLTNLLTKDPPSDFFQPHALLDIILTGLILVGGADRIAEALKLLGGPSTATSLPEKSSSQPIEITGKLILEREKETEPQAAKTAAAYR
jgi:hypothetical protein